MEMIATKPVPRRLVRSRNDTMMPTGNQGANYTRTWKERGCTLLTFLLLILAAYQKLLVKRNAFNDSGSSFHPNSNETKSNEIVKLPETFQCPIGLLPLNSTDVWEWNFTSSRPPKDDTTPRASTTPPQVISFRLDKEKDSFYYNRTKKSLSKYGYPFCETEAVNGKVWNSTVSMIEKRTAITKMHMNLLPREGPGQIGIFYSHMNAWRLGLQHNTPTISLESDTIAIRKWDVDPAIYKDYDILFLHQHPRIKRKCQADEKDTVREGLQFWYAAGAMMYTNNNPEKMERVFKQEFLEGSGPELPVDHWFNKVWKDKSLRVGSLCPPHFRQKQDHESTHHNVDFTSSPKKRIGKKPP